MSTPISGTVPPARATLPTDLDIPIAGHGLAYHRGTPELGGDMRTSGAWRVPLTSLGIIASIDVTDAWGPLLHVSLSYADRDPTWHDIRAVKDAFFGFDRDVMMVLPRWQDYVNVHPHTFQLWESPQVWGIR